MSIASVEITGLTQVTQRLKGLQGAELAKKTDKVLKGEANKVAAAVRNQENFRYTGKGPHHKSTKANTRARKLHLRSGEVSAYSVRPRTPQAHLAIGGTKAHDIRPNGASALALFFGFASEIHHPGAKPNPFVARAVSGLTKGSIAEQIGKELMKK